MIGTLVNFYCFKQVLVSLAIIIILVSLHFHLGGVLSASIGGLGGLYYSQCLVQVVASNSSSNSK